MTQDREKQVDAQTAPNAFTEAELAVLEDGELDAVHGGIAAGGDGIPGYEPL